MDCIHVRLVLVPGKHPKINLFGLQYCVTCCEVETKFWLSLRPIRCVRFARYCGKMYSRHLFSYGGLFPICSHVLFEPIRNIML